MDMKELVKKNTKELEAMLIEKSAALNKFKFGIAGSKIKNVKEGKNLKKEIAQIHTVINGSKEK